MNSKIPHGIKKNINPDEVTSKKLSRLPCGIGTCVIGFALELIQYGKIQKTMDVKERKPKTTIRLNNCKNDFKNTLKVISFIVFTCALEWSIITIPISGKIKKIIPKIGVT